MAFDTETHLTPGARLAIMLQISLAMCSALMTLVCIIVMASNIVLGWKSYRLYDRANQSRQLMLGIFCSDLLTSVGFLLSFQWVKEWTVSGADGSLCTSQAVLIHVGSLLNSVCVSALAMHTMYCMLRDKPVSWKIILLFVPPWMAVVALCPVLGVVTVGKGTWGNSGFWCQLSPRHPFLRFFLLYFPLLVTVIETVFCYCFLAAYLWRRNEAMVRSVVAKKRLHTVRIYTQVTEKNEARLKALMLYPLIYVATVILEASARGFGWAEEVARAQENSADGSLGTRNWALLIGGCLLAAQGAVDVLLYTMTRNVFNINTEPEEERRCRVSSYESVEMPEMRDEEVQQWARQRGLEIPSGSSETTQDQRRLTPTEEREEESRGRRVTR